MMTPLHHIVNGTSANLVGAMQTVGDAFATPQLTRFSGQTSNMGSGAAGPLHTDPNSLQFQNTLAQQSTGLTTMRPTLNALQYWGPKKDGKMFPIKNNKLGDQT